MLKNIIIFYKTKNTCHFINTKTQTFNQLTFHLLILLCIGLNFNIFISLQLISAFSEGKNALIGCKELNIYIGLKKLNTSIIKYYKYITTRKRTMVRTINIISVCKDNIYKISKYHHINPIGLASLRCDGSAFNLQL